MTKLKKNTNCDKTQIETKLKLKLWQLWPNSKLKLWHSKRKLWQLKLLQNTKKCNCEQSQKLKWMKNSNCDETQKLKLWQLKNSICDKTQKLNLRQNSKTKIVTTQKQKLTTQKPHCFKTQKLILWKLKKSNCGKTQKGKLCIDWSSCVIALFILMYLSLVTTKLNKRIN